MTRRASFSASTARWSSFASGIGLLLFPKCPLCCLGYVAALSYWGLDAARLWSGLRLVLLAGLGLSVAVVTTLSARRRDPLPAVLAIGGLSAIIVGCALSRANILSELGAAVVFGAACVNAWRCRTARNAASLSKVC